jgi:hypothetical protein
MCLELVKEYTWRMCLITVKGLHMEAVPGFFERISRFKAQRITLFYQSRLKNLLGSSLTFT